MYAGASEGGGTLVWPGVYVAPELGFSWTAGVYMLALGLKSLNVVCIA